MTVLARYVNCAVSRCGSGEPIYGLTPGIGHLKDTRLPDEELRRAQQVLVMTHAGGIGSALPTALVRAALMVRLNGIARGGSGASPAVAETLAAMLNAGVHPVVAETGSVGAGDLAQMAAIALVAIGMGSAEHAGEVLPGAEALRRAGIGPLELEPKDGLALVSANGISIGHGALVVARAARVVDAADLTAALSLEAIGGNPSVALPVVGRVKPFAGQVEACRCILAALEGSYLLQPAAATSITQTGVYAGAAIGPLGFGVLATHASYPVAWVGAAAAMALAAVFILLGARVAAR